MNIHIKTLSEAHISDNIYTDVQIKKMLDLLDKYDCRKYVYFMTTDTNLQKRLGELAPDIPRCMGEDFDKDKNIVDQAIELGCKKVQLFKPHFTKEMIDKAHAHGIICNVFWSDDVNEAKEFLDMGIDTILTNDYQRVSQIIK